MKVLTTIVFGMFITSCGSDGNWKPCAKDNLDGKCHVHANGADGMDGEVGPQGTQGKDGYDSTDGINGENGENGADGMDGQDGSDGIAGKNGSDGADGSDGSDGADGQDYRPGAIAEHSCHTRKMSIPGNTSGKYRIHYYATIFDNGDMLVSATMTKGNNHSSSATRYIGAAFNKSIRVDYTDTLFATISYDENTHTLTIYTNQGGPQTRTCT